MMRKIEFESDCRRKYGNGGTHVIIETFDSTTEFMKCIERRDVPEGVDRYDYVHMDDSERISDPGWSGATTVGQFRELLDRGVTDTERISQMQRFITKANQGIGVVKKRENRVVGGAVNAARYTVGVPTCMRGVKKEMDTTKTIHVVVDVNVNCNTEGSDLEKCSRYVAATIDKVQRMGYNMKLTCGTFFACDDDLVLGAGCTVKPYGGAISLPRLLYWCGHPAAFRIGCFNYIVGREELPESDYCGLGGSFASRYSEADCQSVYSRVFGNCVGISLQNLVNRRYKTDEEWMRALQTTILGED